MQEQLGEGISWEFMRRLCLRASWIKAWPLGLAELLQQQMTVKSKADRRAAIPLPSPEQLQMAIHSYMQNINAVLGVLRGAQL